MDPVCNVNNKQLKFMAKLVFLYISTYIFSYSR